MSDGPPPLPPIAEPAWLAGVDAPVDARRMQAMRDLLADSPTGAAAVAYLDAHNVPVIFASGGGSYWDGTNIVIDRNESAEEAALTLVHEVNHTRADLEGTGPDIDTDTRADYVQHMLDEEVAGTVASIEAKNELVANGSAVTATFPLEAQYNAAYQGAVDTLTASNPAATEAELRAAGQAAGHDAVMDGFNNGSVVTSNTDEAYPAYYGDAWDGHHNP